jgi:hypothetical protein
MFQIPRVSISTRERDRLKCIQGLIDKQLKQKAVAERLGLSVSGRQSARFDGWLRPHGHAVSRSASLSASPSWLNFSGDNSPAYSTKSARVSVTSQ